MLRWYGYVGLLMIAFAQLNFFMVLQPFAEWYIPIVWYGYILFVDSMVYRLKKQSLISTYPREFLFIAAISLPFWLIFEAYNLFTNSWYYVNYMWYVHIVDFTTIMPAVLETFTLVRVLRIAEYSSLGGFHSMMGRKVMGTRSTVRHEMALKALPLLGILSCAVPLIDPYFGFPFVWLGLFLLLDPINYMMGRPSLIKRYSQGERGLPVQLFIAGIVMGFFWEFWNYMAYAKWIYVIPAGLPNIRLFEMPIYGYLGYLPFALDVFLFYALARSFFFKHRIPLLDIN